MSVVAFPGPADRSHLAAAVDRYLDSVQAATTSANYAETLARLVDVAGADRPVEALTPEDFAAVMTRRRRRGTGTCPP